MSVKGFGSLNLKKRMSYRSAYALATLKMYLSNIICAWCDTQKGNQPLSCLAQELVFE